MFDHLEPVRFVQSLVLVAGFGAACVFSVACGETVDDTVLEASLETRIAAITDTACDRFEECGLIGPEDDDRYATEEECESDIKSDFQELWPTEECDDGRVEASKYEECEERAENYACDQNVFEFISYYDSCKASEVCTDPRN